METIKTFKLLRRDEIGLHPLFIDSGDVLPIGEWLEARAPTVEATIFINSGFALINTVTQGIVTLTQRKPTPIMVKTACKYRNRWIEVVQSKTGKHVYDIGLATNGQVIRFAHHPGWHSSAEPVLPGVNMDGKVWAECLIPANDYTIRHMNINGMTAKSQPVEWYISQKIFITRLLDGT